MARRLALLLGALLLFAGCAGESPIPPQAPAPASDRAGAPQILSPRDLAPRATDPCTTLLEAPQRQQLGLAPPGRFRVTAAGSPTCSWTNTTSGSRIDVSVNLTGDLFVATYRNPDAPIFRPLEIGGLPAVDTLSRADAPSCTTTVGVADSETLDITAFAGDSGGDVAPCEDGHRVAKAIVFNLPPKQR